MPISFLPYPSIYTYDYPALFVFLNGQRIFRSAKVQARYLRDWIDYLQYLDKEAVSHFKEGGIFPNIEVERNHRTEIFEAGSVCDDCVIRIHFAISKLLLLLDDELTDEDISSKTVSSFTDTNSVVLRIPPSIALSYELHKPDPILIAQYPVGGYKFYVIDGNHRLDYCINNNYEQISAVTLNTELLLARDVFASKFDEALYILLLETDRLRQWLQRGVREEACLLLRAFHASPLFCYIQKYSSYLYTTKLTSFGYQNSSLES